MAVLMHGSIIMWDPRLKPAIEQEDIQTVLELMDQGADVNEKNNTDKRTPLYLAVIQNNKAMIQAIVNHPRFSYTDLTGWAVHRAVFDRRWDLLPILLSKHTDESIKIDHWRLKGKSVLRIAVEQQDIEAQTDALNLLLDHGADPNHVNPRDSETPIDVAIEKKLTQTILAILAHRDFTFTDYHIHLLYLLIHSSQQTLFNALLDKHTPVSSSIDKLASDRMGSLLDSAIRKRWHDSIKKLIEHGANAGTPLSLAIARRDEEVIQEILTHKDFKYTVETGLAIFQAIDTNRPELLIPMLEKHRDPSIPVSSPLYNSGEKSPFRMAVEKGYEDAALLLLRHEFKLSSNDKNDLPLFLKTALRKKMRSLAVELAKHASLILDNEVMDLIQEALLSHQSYIIPSLLNKQTWQITYIDYTLGYPKGWNALAKAVDDNLQDIVLLLMDRGANANMKLARGETPLSIAITNAYDRLAEAIVRHKHFKFTMNTGIAIMACLINEKTKLIPLLLEKLSNKSFSIADYTLWEGCCTALELARIKGFERIEDLLIEHSWTDLVKIQQHLRGQLFKAIKRSDLLRIGELLKDEHLEISRAERLVIEASIASGNIDTIRQVFFPSSETQTEALIPTSGDSAGNPFKQIMQDQGTQTEPFIKNSETLHSSSTPRTPLILRRYHALQWEPTTAATHSSQSTQTSHPVGTSSCNKGVQASEISYKRPADAPIIRPNLAVSVPEPPRIMTFQKYK
jgi:ankyrin repeat protein